MHTVMNGSDKVIVESSDQCNQQLRASGSRISICHVSEGSAWAGAEAQVMTLLRALSRCPEIALCVIVLNEGRLADELRGVGIDVQVVSEQRKSFPRLVLQC